MDCDCPAENSTGCKLPFSLIWAKKEPFRSIFLGFRLICKHSSLLHLWLSSSFFWGCGGTLPNPEG